MTASVQITQLVNHVLRFTQTENTGLIYILRGWLANQSVSIGANEVGDDCWATTSLYEHFDSALPPDQTTWTTEETTIFNALQAKALASQAKLDEILGVASEETVRVNANVAALAASLLASL